MILSGGGVLLGIAGCADVLGINTDRYYEELSEGQCVGTLRVRVMADETGPTKDVGLAGGKGVVDYLRAVDATGGIRGCNLDIEVADTRYDVETTLAAYRRWQAAPEWPEVSTVFGQGSPMTLAVGPLAAEEGKVVVTTAQNGEFATPRPVSHDVGVPALNDSFAPATFPSRKTSLGYPSVFFQGTDYTTTARIAMNFAWKNSGKRVGFFACSTSAFCTNPVDGAKTFLPTLQGIAVGRDLALELGDDDAIVEKKTLKYFQEEVAHAEADGSYAPVDWIWFGNTRTTLARLGRALAKVKATLGIAPKVISNTYGMDELLYSECGDACLGFYSVQSIAMFGDPTEPGMAKVVELHAKARRDDGEDESLYATTPFVHGYVAAATWKAAVESVLDAREPVTGETIRLALETFQQRSIAGLASVSYSATDHRPQASVRVYTLGPKGALSRVGQPLSVSLQPAWLGW